MRRPAFPTSDRRVRRTRKALHDALAALIHEKSYRAIAVREILDRADVGRSTFYQHYGSKDELLASGIREIMASAGDGCGTTAERILASTLRFLEHLEIHRRGGGIRVGPRGRAVLHEHLRRVLVESIAAELARGEGQDGNAYPAAAADLRVRQLASTFVTVLDWWIETRAPLGPREVNELFRTLATPALDAISRPGRPERAARALP